MTDVEPSFELLTREELDALLAQARERGLASDVPSQLAEPFRRQRSPEALEPAPRAPRLRSALGEVVTAWTRRLASRHQRRIHCSLLDWTEVETRSLVETLPASDGLVAFDALPSSANGFVLLARPLAFALLTLDFGGRRADRDVPSRSYSRIERRFLRRIATELLAELEARWRPWSSVQVSVGDVHSPAEFHKRKPSTLLLASFDITGLGVIGRLRIALPESPFRIGSSLPRPQPRRTSELEGAIQQIELRLSEELGSTEMRLSELGKLKPGDLVDVRRAVSDGLLVRIEGRPKFRAVRGSVNGRLAVQMVERVDAGGAGR